jgi:2,4-dienoyl-CoA reductase-like NADH-dependent reductase (Old Yellow Enzyme family)
MYHPILTSGIYTDAHVEEWKTITTAVHQAGSKLFIQLMHVGRMSHPDNAPSGAQAGVDGSMHARMLPPRRAPSTENGRPITVRPTFKDTSSALSRP